MGVALSPTVVIDDTGFGALVAAITAGHRTVGPIVRDGTIVMSEVGSVHDLASGVTLDQAPGRCRVAELPEGDRRRFAWAVGPQSAKGLQHPSERELFTARLDGDGFTVLPAAPGRGADGSAEADRRPVAIIGLRPCDVAATGVLDRVLGTDSTGGIDPLVVVVNCAEPGGTCFCASMDTGPSLAADLGDRVDVVVWERGRGTAPEYLVTATTGRGRDLLDGLDRSGRPDGGEIRAATGEDVEWAEATTADAAARMGRTLHTDGLAERLVATLDSPRWDDIATRCLSCANCTMVCPTCFCTSTHDSSSLDGTTVSRSQSWDSCFTLEHSFIHGGSVRSTTSDRYRQWLTHKLSTWWAQFGESGCVGCGRCISWCPVGIDLVTEANALAREAGTLSPEPDPAPDSEPDSEPDPATSARWSVTDVLVRRRTAVLSRVTQGELADG